MDYSGSASAFPTNRILEGFGMSMQKRSATETGQFG